MLETGYSGCPHLTHSGSNGGGSGIPSSSSLTTTTSGMLLFPLLSLLRERSFSVVWYPFLPFPFMFSQPFVWLCLAVLQVLPMSTTATLSGGTTRTVYDPMGDGRENADIVVWVWKRPIGGIWCSSPTKWTGGRSIQGTRIWAKVERWSCMETARINVKSSLTSISTKVWQKNRRLF